MLGFSAFLTIIGMWLPLSWLLNMVNRSMDHGDLYLYLLRVDARRFGQDAVN